MRVFTYIAPAMRPRGTSNRNNSQRESNHVYSQTNYLYIHIYITIYFTFFFQTKRMKLRENTFKERLLQQLKRSTIKQLADNICYKLSIHTKRVNESTY